VLGPTHEEVITHLAAAEINSYRQMPKNFYQIQTKFRDEIRPRFGLMRAKEFIMKDAYSFDADEVGAKKSYEAMVGAYRKIFSRVGLQALQTEADTGVMGGASSHEFSVPAEIGEGEIVTEEGGSYAAAIEKAEGKPAEGKATAVVAAARGGVELLREGRAVTEDQLIAQLRNSFVSDLGYAEQHRTSQDAASTVGAAASAAVSAFQAPSLGPIHIGGGASDADAALKRNALSSLLSMRAKEIEATQREQCVKTSRQLVSAYQQQVARLQPKQDLMVRCVTRGGLLPPTSNIRFAAGCCVRHAKRAGTGRSCRI
jgi:hypothetical protein